MDCEDQTHALFKKISDVIAKPIFLFNPAFSMEMLCREVGSNVKYVSVVINATYGKNFKTLINERRVREGARRLTEGEKYQSETVEAVALSLGYNSSTSFIIAFKRVMGMTPAVYKRLVQQRNRQL